MIFKNTTAEEISELLDSNILFITREDSPINIVEDIDDTLLLTFNRNISTTDTKIINNIVSISYQNLPLIIIYPRGLIFKCSLYQKIYFSNLQIGYELYEYSKISLYLTNLNFSFDLNKSIYKETVIRPKSPILKFYFYPHWTCKIINPHVYFLKDTVYFTQLFDFNK